MRQTARASKMEYQKILPCVERTVDSFRLFRVWKLQYPRPKRTLNTPFLHPSSRRLRNEEGRRGPGRQDVLLLCSDDRGEESVELVNGFFE
jgi:hypothetical protein